MQFEYIIVDGAVWHLNETLEGADDIHLGSLVVFVVVVLVLLVKV